MNEKMSLMDQVSMLSDYLSQKYEFRQNVLSNRYELRQKPALTDDRGRSSLMTPDCHKLTPFRPLTREAMNSIARKIKENGLEIESLRQNIEEYVYSEETPQYDPIAEFLSNLPQWDGRNHIAELFARIPGIDNDQRYLMTIWLRSVVAHWRGLDTLHGNECVVTLIGKQGCGKSTWCARLLPPSLRTYYLDHLNLGNKFDKEMALTNNLLVNLDELDQIRPSQHAQLKQTLSKVQVNGRPIFGREQRCRRRYASFVATTNNEHPLNDRTGNRRYICIQIPDGRIIDNETEIDYIQLYAQVMHELDADKLRYWFTNEEVAMIEKRNASYQAIMDLESMVDYCYRAPKEGEVVKPILASEILKKIASEFPIVKVSSGTNVHVGRILRSHNFESKISNQGRLYFVVPRAAA